MINRFARLLAELPPADEGSTNVLPYAESLNYFAGRDEFGCAVLLIRTKGSGFAIPMGLAGLSASFDLLCNVQEPGGTSRLERLTTISCKSTSPEIEAYFCAIVEILIPLIGDSPTADQVSDAIEQMVELFQKLRQPSRRSVVGLVGELVVIYAALDASSAVQAWRQERGERYDFSHGNLRLEAKSSGSRRRVHEISFDQAHPPPTVCGFLASLIVEQSAGGSSLAELLALIEKRLNSPLEAIRVRTVVADTLGRDMASSLGWRFDLPQALASLTIFDLRIVPAIHPPVPSGVSNVRFLSDLSDCASVDVKQVGLLSADERKILPAPLINGLSIEAAS